MNIAKLQLTVCVNSSEQCCFSRTVQVMGVAGALNVYLRTRVSVKLTPSGFQLHRHFTESFLLPLTLPGCAQVSPACF